MALARKRIMIVGGARPNFIKIAPLQREFTRRGAQVFIVNAGQHASVVMNSSFFKEFGMKAAVTLRPSQQNPARQFEDMIQGISRAIDRFHPDLVIVVGDVNATLAGAIAAKLSGVRLAHVEAGLRSFNSAMLEERNRILVDHLADFLFATEEDAIKNLKREGLSGNVFLVGNIMIDAARLFSRRAHRHRERFFFCTLHRAENVDSKRTLSSILDALEIIGKDAPIYLPLHPRTEKRVQQFGLGQRVRRIFNILPPQPYAATLGFERDAELVLTDSGGMQEETTFFGTPCLTLREETERPITVSRGTNIIGGVTKRSILTAYWKRKKRRKIQIPLWDGKTAKRIAERLSKLL